MSHPYSETWVEKQIREAQARGEFDNLPGAGKPLTNLGDPNDGDWWIRDFLRRESLDMSSALPAPLALRREASEFPGSLADVRTEPEVREILEDYNRRVRVDRLRPAVGDLPPLLARTVDVDDLVGEWRVLREERAAALAARRAEQAVATSPPVAPRPWWRRLSRREARE